jgi:hypothetical protein
MKIEKPDYDDIDLGIMMIGRSQDLLLYSLPSQPSHQLCMQLFTRFLSFSYTPVRIRSGFIREQYSAPRAQYIH